MGAWMQIQWQGKVLVTVSNFGNQVTSLVFGNGITQAPTSRDSVILVGSSLVIDVKLIESCGNWYAIVISYDHEDFSD